LEQLQAQIIKDVLSAKKIFAEIKKL